ncbi:late embryogenesis abundant protein D-34 [Cucumis melo var. makuwa]|uniref:Late embryogenesis abundant protein D-34 n=1 Tax=Cucumis melo var. makuwa TaxID=1194695 RepID=A0A5D3DRQ0_CUCMM|nr:late embryogenesis abundant protein D-34 [Cucumis melo var. makuwa]TYK26218.1 late embryogenesis abundant protein D-34 [Cucumis melo var. makuwa]
MSQPQRPAEDNQDPIKYGDVFDVSGELASKPIAPRDAATLQAAENMVLGQTPRGGPAAVMQSAANLNERAGLVGHSEVTDVAVNEGVNVTETVVDGQRFVVVGQFVQPNVPMRSPGATLDKDSISIGEALEASAVSAGDKPIDQSDAAAIQAAELRATGENKIIPGGIGAEAQSAATLNTRAMRNEDKTTLGDILTDATRKLPGDKTVTKEDAERVISAEIRNAPTMATTPGGVAASVAAAARLNQRQG